MPVSPAGDLPRLLVMGDSITRAYYEPLVCLLAGKFSCELGPPLREHLAQNGLEVSHATTGRDSEAALAYLRLRQATNPLRADVVLFNSGLHDLITQLRSGSKRVPPKLYRENLQAILSEIRSMSAQPVWVRTTPLLDEIPPRRSAQRYAADVDLYNGIADAVMLENGVPVLDLHRFSLPDVPTGMEDLVHFSPATAARQAAFIAEGLEAYRGK